MKRNVIKINILNITLIDFVNPKMDEFLKFIDNKNMDGFSINNSGGKKSNNKSVHEFSSKNKRFKSENASEETFDLVLKMYNDCQTNNEKSVLFNKLKGLSSVPKSFSNPLHFRDDLKDKVLTYQDLNDQIQQFEPHNFVINGRNVIFFPVKHIQHLDDCQRDEYTAELIEHLSVYKSCDALLLEGNPMCRSEDSRGFFNKDYYLRTISGLGQGHSGRGYQHESDIFMNHFGDRLGDVYCPEPSDSFITKTIVEKSRDLNMKYVAAYYLFRELPSLFNRSNKDSFLNDVNDLCARTKARCKLNFSFSHEDAKEMARSILTNPIFDFTYDELSPKIVQQLHSCAVPPKTALTGNVAESINKVANLATYARDLTIIHEIDHATKTEGYDTIVVVYGAGHFLTQQPALDYLHRPTKISI